ncbi:MAG TPA: CsbD family protein [Rhodospirillaceae bacterium]|nr:CsbD family protein [Rhodospirillaceae bacterium]
MNKDIIEGNWKVLKGEVQKRWGKLTDDHLDQVEGSRTKLSGLIQKNYGLATDAADKQIAEWESERAKAERAARDSAA